jgi:superfamily II DNA or RNA helicase
MDHFIGRRGIALLKSKLTNTEIERIKNELTVTPYQNKMFSGNEEAKPYKVYLESSKYYYVPIHWGKQYYKNLKDKRPISKKIDIKFNGELRELQQEVMKEVFPLMDRDNGIILSLQTGQGKTICGLYILSQLKVKTMIMVHKEFLMNQWVERIQEFLPNASIGILQQKKCELDNDIVIGMIQTLCSKDYEKDTFNDFGLIVADECFPYYTGIITDKGVMYIGSLYNKWKNNEELPKILSYNQYTKNFEYKEMTYSWEKVNEKLIEIAMSKKKIKCTLNHKILTINGYIEANKLNIGDIIISKYDKSHFDNIIAPALNNDQLQIIYGSYLGDGHISITKKNRYRLEITHCKKQNDYCNWKANMFGINNLKCIEKNGYSKKTAYNFQTKIFDLEYNIPKNTKEVPDWLLDKLDIKGIAVWFMDDGSNNIRKNKNGTISNYISIHTNNFNYKTQEKFVKKFKNYDIDCSIKKTRNYYYISFNKENSNKLLKLIEPYIHPCFNYKIYSNINTEDLINKNKYIWDYNFLNYGTLKVSSIKYIKNKKEKWQKKPYVYDIEVKDNHNFVIGTKIKSKKNIQYIDGPVVSNCHHMSSKHFSKAMRKFTPKYTLGLTATPNRNDGLTRVFMWSLGMNIIKKERAKLLVNIEMHHFTSDLEEKLNTMGKLNYSRMINDIAENESRNQYLLKIIQKQADDNKKIIILSHRRNHIKYLKEEIDTLNKYTTGYYVGGMKQSDLKESEEKQIIFATMSMSEEGLDIPSLNCAILATPKSNVEQAVGRVLRKKSYEIPPLVIDIVDTYSVFFAQANKRKKFYLSQDFDVYRIYPNENKIIKEGKKNKKEIKKNKKTMIESLFLEDN